MAYSRNNNSTAAEFTDSLVPFASGSFKYVWQGHYTDGPRKGQKCVAKAFKTGSVFEDHFFELEMAVIEETRKIVNAWNNARIVDLPIKLSKPQIWTDVNGQKFLIEPFIENFQKFNSNSGYVTLQGDTWSDALQALSHFSYYNSRGQMLLCDIQGGIYQDGFVLSDPAISSSTGSYGPSDLGQEGIDDFFAQHRCNNQYCRPTWGRPMVSGRATFAVTQGTTMIDRRPSLQLLSN